MRARPASCRSAAPIGTNKGSRNRDFIKILIDEIDLPIIVDAGISRPSQACEAMEMARRPSWRTPPSRPQATSRQWLRRSKKAIEAGRAAYLAGLGRVRETASALVSADRIFTGLKSSIETTLSIEEGYAAMPGHINKKNCASLHGTRNFLPYKKRRYTPRVFMKIALQFSIKCALYCEE